MAAGYRRMTESGGKAARKGSGIGVEQVKILPSGYDERAIPIQKAAISSADSASNTRIRFFRTAKMTTAIVQSRKPNSGQNNPEPPPPHPPDASCIKNEADEVAAVRRAPSAPASATPLAQSGSTQFFRASRQSSQVCATTTPTIIKTNSATFPLLSANRFGYRNLLRCLTLRGRARKLLQLPQRSRAAAVEFLSALPRIARGSVASTDPVALASELLCCATASSGVPRKSSTFPAYSTPSPANSGSSGFAKSVRAIGLPKGHMVSQHGGISILLQRHEI